VAEQGLSTGYCYTMGDPYNISLLGVFPVLKA